MFGEAQFQIILRYRKGPMNSDGKPAIEVTIDGKSHNIGSSNQIYDRWASAAWLV
jgi:hypothetical protein